MRGYNNVVCWVLFFFNCPALVSPRSRVLEKEAQTQSGLGKNVHRNPRCLGPSFGIHGNIHGNAVWHVLLQSTLHLPATNPPTLITGSFRHFCFAVDRSPSVFVRRLCLSAGFVFAICFAVWFSRRFVSAGVFVVAGFRSPCCCSPSVFHRV